jgi:hypothetical protein
LITIMEVRSERLAAFHRDPWPIQQSFSTPLQGLNHFVSVIADGIPWEVAELTTDEVVFEPCNTLQLMERKQLQLEDYWDFNLRVEGQTEIAETLEALLGDSIDFLFLPSPESIAIYADHDEYTTFYSKAAESLKALTQRLTGAGFKSVEGYTRGRSGDKLR